MKLTRWARATLLIGAIITAIGVVPLGITTTFLPGADPVLFALAFFLLAPLGVVILAFGVILWVIGKFQDRG